MFREPIHAVVSGDLNLLRCLIGRGIPVTVVASDPREPTLRSRHSERTFLIAPPSNPERAVSDLEKLADRFVDKPVFYYGNDATLLMVSRARERLAKHYRFSLPPRELVEALVDKARFAELARKRNLRVPASVRSEQLQSAKELFAHVNLPCAF
jgi:predicted ATP-grasp superfamily ATP-dependent carboligase